MTEHLQPENKTITSLEPTSSSASLSNSDIRALERLDVFSKFLSEALLKDLAEGQISLNHQSKEYPAAVLFADVSGFTNLMEKLMGQYGRGQAIGAEHLSMLLSDYFDHLIEVVKDHQGDVIKFAGDAMLILFPCTNGKLGLKRAVSCGVAMQKVAKDVSAKILKQHRVSLSLKVAVSSGNIVGLVLGGVLGRWEYAVLSNAISDVGRLGDVALPDDVLISADCISQINSDELHSEQRAIGVYNVTHTPDWELKTNQQPFTLTPDIESKVRCFVPAAVASRIAAGQTDAALLGELRRVSVLFINLPQFKVDISIELAQQIVTTIQQVCYGQRGSLDKISCDDKGVSIIAGFGIPPMSAEDDPLRAVKAAMNTNKLLKKMGLDVSIGVASGPVYCGTLGEKYRCEYTLMGDGVNTAARLMSLADGGVLCDSVTAEACSDEVQFDKGRSVNLKGKDLSVDIYRPLTLTSTTSELNISLVGRKKELDYLNESVNDFDENRHAKCVVIEGEAGMGKTVLVTAFQQSLSIDYEDTFFKASASAVQISFYGVWRELLYQALNFNELTNSSDKQAYLIQLANAIPNIRREMLPLLNDILELGLPETNETSSMPSETRAENIRFLIGQILQNTHVGQRKILVVDDAQWMDSSSWLLLDSLIRELKNTLFIILTQPFSGEPPTSFEKIVELLGTRRMSLEAMSKPEVSALVCRALDVQNVPDEILELIRERGEGHPLYSEVLANDLREREILLIEEGVCTLAPGIKSAQDIELPSSIESAIVSRLERLSLDQQLALKTASIIGRQFSMEELHHIYPVETDREALHQDIDALSIIGMTQPKVRHVDYLFTHRATQKVAYDLMLYSQRKKMHRQIALWLERNSHEVAGKNAELAIHWQRAEDPEKALHYFALAIEESFQLFANRETLNYLEKIQKLLSENHLTVSRLKQARWKSMGGAAQLAMGYPEEAEQDFSEALELLGIHLPKSKLGFIARALGQIGKQLQHHYLPFLDKKVDTDKVPETHLAALIMDKQFLVYYYLEKMEGLIYSAFAATNLAEATNDNTPTLSRSYSTMGNALAGIPLMKLSKFYIARSEEVASAIDDPGTWAWYHLAGGMCLAQDGNWSGHDKALLKSQELAKSQGDRRRWEEAASVYCIAGLTCGDFHSIKEDGHIYQQIYASGFSRGVYQTQAWGYCMWAMSAIMQGHYGVAKKITAKLDKLYQRHPEGFDPVNVLEASSSISLLAIREHNHSKAIESIKLGASVVKDWGRPTTWRSIPCCYAQGEAAIRLWGIEVKKNANERDPNIEKWVQLSLKHIRAHTSIYSIAVSRQKLLQGWYDVISGQPKKAARSWAKGLKAATQYGMKFDILALNLAFTNLDQTLKEQQPLMSSDQINQYAKQLNVNDLAWFRDWRIVPKKGSQQNDEHTHDKTS
ncbi:adenylate/guanylate cyclase domain-containing protein [Arenicella sp. 4NH20-0111]|uniref:adenylate/guanylate cyclase domain-containing protein n=1 Tax=Arenicella sp. 4NH20-0111 TaxID=3127648 RepID=UPI00333FBB43